jgi:hypothetical protein
VTIARESLQPFGGSIYLDPFSEPEFNECVGAKRILTGEPGLDGFRDRWVNADSDFDPCPRADHLLAGYPVAGYNADRAALARSALVNPPGDDTGDNVKKAWRLLDRYHELGWIDSAVWVAFNLNQLQTLQGISVRSPLCDEFVRAIPDTRLAFASHSSRPAGSDDAPSHPCFFLLMPSHAPHLATHQVQTFGRLASELGEVF